MKPEGFMLHLSCCSASGCDANSGLRLSHVDTCRCLRGVISEAKAMATPTRLGKAVGGPAPTAKQAVRAGDLLATRIFNRSTACKLGCQAAPGEHPTKLSGIINTDEGTW